MSESSWVTNFSINGKQYEGDDKLFQLFKYRGGIIQKTFNFGEFQFPWKVHIWVTLNSLISFETQLVLKEPNTCAEKVSYTYSIGTHMHQFILSAYFNFSITLYLINNNKCTPWNFNLITLNKFLLELMTHKFIYNRRLRSMCDSD